MIFVFVFSLFYDVFHEKDIFVFWLGFYLIKVTLLSYVVVETRRFLHSYFLKCFPTN